MIDPISKGIDDLGNSLLQALNNVQGIFGKELSVAKPIHDNILQLIGNTPLIRLNRIGSEYSGVQFYLKAEFLNPTGSAKDRTAIAMYIDAERRGKLKKGMSVVLVGAGSSSVSFTWIGKVKGYPVYCLVPLHTAPERIQLLRSYGADVTVTGEGDLSRLYDLAEEKAKKLGGWIPDEASNPANPNFHFKTTGPEIWRDLQGKVGAVISAPGSGGAITGIGRYLKSQDRRVKVIIAGKQNSPFMEYGKTDNPKERERIQLPAVYDPKLIDHYFHVTQDEALHLQADLYEKEGIFAGLTTGTVITGALRFSESLSESEKNERNPYNIVILSPDRD
ncbi:PLP-dependent cysteine synthase family protein [Leptospira meyeri]|uniref:PLP-dependent cysteine synthase family protein n=1 Tax=Leptospira meyeri TaxID=29508 RepID=UPI000C2ADF52|nr:PLP-dependent cysteine synthase family protein [Leptospira meyeri]PKA24383.1 cysteine synthase [Leptospira sp. mixed culture ATI2-C-A1]MCW7490004.1 PLP-dependent cysteine synthase family protein [Leptospira meyeri]PJZ82569.1 cysteine synthase [Leptospira meyeri]PJZ98189.1 cysteine synthase [Leptospira meyeri]PKA12981.1 cysteine synthase [Leptospira meyeri]